MPEKQNDVYGFLIGTVSN